MIKADPGILKFNFIGKSGYKKEFDWKAVQEPTKYDIQYQKDLQTKNQRGELAATLGSPFKGKQKYAEDFKKTYQFKQSSKFTPIDEVSTLYF